MINRIIEYINSIGRFKSNRELIENSLWFHLSSYISLINPVINYNNKNIPINYFGISIARSGSGKSFIYNKVKELFRTTKWEQALEISYNRANQDIPSDDITIEGEKYNVKNFLPNYENTIEGTREGLYLRCLALSKCFSGSINLINEEIMDIVVGSNLDTMKELYDGNFLGKVIKGSINKNIYNIRANMLLFGSSTGLKKDEKIYNTFQKSLNSGIYRRSFIYYEEPNELQINNAEPTGKPNLEYIDEIISNNKKSFLEGFPTIIEVNNESYKLLDEINKELLEFSNEYIDDERYSAEIGSFDKILKLAGLHAILHFRYIIEPTDIEYAYDFYKRCRETTKTLFNIEPQHKRIYKLIKRLGKCTKSDILEKDIFNRMSFNEDINLVHEYCYKNNEQLIISGSKIKFYQIKELDDNNINKIICSIPKVDKKEKTVQYASMYLPLFGNRSIEQLVGSDKVSNFTLCHFKDGKRKKENTLEKINCIGIDVDDGNLEEIKKQLDDNDLIYIIYTTKSHQKEKNGFISDRFRIILPLANVIEIELSRYKTFIENICFSLGINVYDDNATDISRLWFTNPNGLIYKNQKGILFNAIPYLPDTLIEQKIEQIDLSDNEDEIQRRINGMIRYTIASTGSGNRNNNLMRLCLFVYDLTNDKELSKSVVLSTNNMLNEPLEIREIEKTIFRTLERK